MSSVVVVSCQVMCVLLAENIQQFGAKDQQVNITEQLSFSAGCVRVPSTQSFLAGESGMCVLRN